MIHFIIHEFSSTILNCSLKQNIKNRSNVVSFLKTAMMFPLGAPSNVEVVAFLSFITTCTHHAGRLHLKLTFHLVE